MNTIVLNFQNILLSAYIEEMNGECKHVSLSSGH